MVAEIMENYIIGTKYNFINSIQFYLFLKLNKLKVFKLQRSNIMKMYFIK